MINKFFNFGGSTVAGFTPAVLTASSSYPHNPGGGGIDLTTTAYPQPQARFGAFTYGYGNQLFTATGLTPNAQYKVIFDISSDNPYSTNYSINGAVVLTNFLGVGYKAYSNVFTATANSAGEIAIRLDPGAGSPYGILSALQFIEADTTAPYFTGLSATAVSSSQVSIVYNAYDESPGAVKVDLDYSLDNTNWTPLLSNSAAASPYSHTGLSSSTLYYYRIRARDFAGNVSGYLYLSATTFVYVPPAFLNHGFPTSGAELLIEPDLDSWANGQPIAYLTDFSLKNRTLTAGSSVPLCSRPALNGRAVVRFNGSNSPMSNAANFKVNCGWIVAKYAGDLFANFNGLLTDLQTQGILVGNSGAARFFNFDNEYYEYRAADRIYSSSNASAPMDEFKVLFFRYWQPVQVSGVQIGQDRQDTGRRWNGDIAFLALYSRNFCESDVRKYTKILADLYALGLADVYPFQADQSSTETSAQKVNFYDPPEGNRIAESIESPNRSLDLKFSSRRTKELLAMRDFHHAHYAAAVPCIYRDYSLIPPEDVEGYIDSEYEKSGSLNNYNYSFSFRENNNPDVTLPPAPAANYLEVVDSETGLTVVQEI